LRTRGIYGRLGERGKEIEKQWDKADTQHEERYFTALFSKGTPPVFSIYEKTVPSGIKEKYKRVISHSFGIDVVFGAFLIADLLKLVCVNL